MKQIKNNFIFFGAVHQDFVFELKNELIKYRTNPVNHYESYGGVAHNVAKLIAAREKVSLASINSDNETINYLKKNKIEFFNLNKKIQKRYYAVLLNKSKKLQLGIANTDAYEQCEIKSLNFRLKNKHIIIDLNFSEKIIKNIIDKYFKNNKIIICGTSLFKIYKIKSHLNKIDCLILNKEELFNLTNIRSIPKSIKYIAKKNPNINLIVSNGGNKTYGYELSNVVSVKPPKIKVLKENGAGDSMAGNYIYYRYKNFSLEKSLSLGVATGTLHAKIKKNIQFKEVDIKKIIKKIKIQKENINVK